MKDLVPLPVMPGVAVSGKTAAAGLIIGTNGVRTDVSGVVSAGLAAPGRSFSESLAGLLQAVGSGEEGLADLTGGKSLPLATPAAKPSLTVSATASGVSTIITGMSTPVSSDLAPSSGDAQHLENTTLTAGLSAVAPLAMPHDAETPEAGPAFSGLAKLTPRTASQLANTAVLDHEPQLPDRPVSRESSVSLPAVQVAFGAEVAISSAATPAQIARGLPASLFHPDSSIRGTSVKAGLTQPLNVSEPVDVQQPLKAETVLTETDRLFTSRIPFATVNQPAELAAQKWVTDALSNTVQSTHAESVHTSLTRSPMLQTTLSADAPSAAAQTVISEAFGKPEWGQGMGKQMLWLVNQNISRAEIRLNPAHLGPLEVRIDMENDQVNVVFASRHAEVREAVEQALPRLREMLEEKGLNLADADVSEHSFSEQHRQASGHDASDTQPAHGSISSPGDNQMADGGHPGTSPDPKSSMLYANLVDYYI